MAQEAPDVIVSVIFIGCTIFSIILSGFGIARRSPALLVGGAMLASPLAFYLGAIPMFRTVGFLLPLPQLVAAFVVKRRAWLAILLVSPLLAAALWLAVVVLRQSANAAA